MKDTPLLRRSILIILTVVCWSGPTILFAANCGDNICATDESCATCPADCGVCNDASAIYIDNGSAGTSSVGTWAVSGGTDPYGANSLWSKTDSGTYTWQRDVSGPQSVYLWWTAYSSRCAAVPVKIYNGASLIKSLTINQKTNGGKWNFLGTYDIDSQLKVQISVDLIDGCSTCADAVKIAPVAAVGSGVIDNGDPGTTAVGTWPVSGGTDAYGSNSLYSKSVGSTYQWQSNESGPRDVFMWWSAYSSRCTSVPVQVYDGSTLLDTLTINQQAAGGQWNRLGTYTFNGTARVRIPTVSSACSTCADAVSFGPAGSSDASDEIIDNDDPGTTEVGSWPVSGGTDPYGDNSLYSKTVGSTYTWQGSKSGRQDVYLWWTAYDSRCTEVPVQIYDGSTLKTTVTVNQKYNGGKWNKLGTYDFTNSPRVKLPTVSTACSTCADAARFAASTAAVTPTTSTESVVPPPITTTRKGIIFYDDAENAPDTSTDWLIAGNYGANSLSVSGDQVRAGSKSYKFILAPYGTAGTETNVELILRGLNASPQVKNFTYGQEYWMGWSVYIPKDFVFPGAVPGDWGILGQFHGSTEACDYAKMGPNAACYTNYNTKGFDFKISATSEACEVDGKPSRSKTYLSPALKKGAWNDVVLNFRYNYVNTGEPFFKMWLNGMLVANDVGANCYNDAKPPYFKMGIYANSPDQLTAYYDEIRIGDETSDYASVAP